MLVPKTGDGVLYYLCLYHYVLVLIHRIICICFFHVTSQSVQHLRWLELITSSLHAVHLARLLKLDTLPPFFYYELLVTHIIGRWSSEAVDDDAITWYMELKEEDGIHNGLQVSFHMLHYIFCSRSRAIARARSSQLVRPWVTLNTMQLNEWADDNLF